MSDIVMQSYRAQISKLQEHSEMLTNRCQEINDRWAAENQRLVAELAKLKAARELSAEASATMRDESLAHQARIRELEAALALRCPQCDMRLIERTTLETISKQPDEYAAHSPECYLRKYREGYCDCELPQSDRKVDQ